MDDLDHNIKQFKIDQKQAYIEYIDRFIRLNQNLLEGNTSGIDVFAVKEKIDKLLDKRLELTKGKTITTIGEALIEKLGEGIDACQASRDLSERLKDMREDIINKFNIPEIRVEGNKKKTVKNNNILWTLTAFGLITMGILIWLFAAYGIWRLIGG